MNAALDREPRSAPRALVVEDSEHTAYLLAFMLERAGYAVTTAANGREAESVLSGEDAIDVVLLDLVLPHVSGFELLMQMREDQRRRSTPVVVVSGKSLEADVVRAFELGADDFVSKPFRPQELMARIRRLTDASRRSSHAP